MTTEYLVECLWPGVTEADLKSLHTRARTATVGSVRYLGTRLVTEDDVVFCFFEGPSNEAVRVAAEAVGIPFERILATLRVGAAAAAKTERSAGCVSR
jgi:Protein of unknown function (DUF4242)